MSFHAQGTTPRILNSRDMWLTWPVALMVHLVSVVSDQVQTHSPYTVTFDLTDPGTIVAATAEILQCFGHVDVLINNAGVSYRGAIVDTTMDVDKRVMETNYFGPIALTKGNNLGLKGKRAQMCWYYFTSLGSFLANVACPHPLFYSGTGVVITPGCLHF